MLWREQTRIPFSSLPSIRGERLFCGSPDPRSKTSRPLAIARTWWRLPRY